VWSTISTSVVVPVAGVQRIHVKLALTAPNAGFYMISGLSLKKQGVDTELLPVANFADGQVVSGDEVIVQKSNSEFISACYSSDRVSSLSSEGRYPAVGRVEGSVCNYGYNQLMTYQSDKSSCNGWHGLTRAQCAMYCETNQPLGDCDYGGKTCTHYTMSDAALCHLYSSCQAPLDDSSTTTYSVNRTTVDTTPMFALANFRSYSLPREGLQVVPVAFADYTARQYDGVADYRSSVVDVISGSALYSSAAGKLPKAQQPYTVSIKLKRQRPPSPLVQTLEQVFLH